MDCYKLLHFFYDLSNLWHFLSLQSAFSFTSRDSLRQNVKGLWEGKGLPSSPLNSQKKTQWALQTWAELNYIECIFLSRRCREGRQGSPWTGPCPAVSLSTTGLGQGFQASWWAAASCPSPSGWCTPEGGSQ